MDKLWKSKIIKKATKVFNSNANAISFDAPESWTIIRSGG